MRKNVDVKHGLIIESLYEVVNINMKISIVWVQFLTFFATIDSQKGYYAIIFFAKSWCFCYQEPFT